MRDGKGAKDRTVPVVPHLGAILAEYRRTRGLLFGGVTAATIATDVQRHLRATFDADDCVFHQLRHTFGTYATEATGGNVGVVAKLNAISNCSQSG